MDLRTFLLGAAVFGGAFVVMVFFAPELLKSDPAVENQTQQKTAKVEPAPEPPMDENDSDNEGRAEETPLEQAEEEANPFGER